MAHTRKWFGGLYKPCEDSNLLAAACSNRTHDTYCNITDAQSRASELECTGTHVQGGQKMPVYKPCNDAVTLEGLCTDNTWHLYCYARDAEAKAAEIGCSGTHPEGIFYRPCTNLSGYGQSSYGDLFGLQVDEHGNEFYGPLTTLIQRVEFKTVSTSISQIDSNKSQIAESIAELLRTSKENVEIDVFGRVDQYIVTDIVVVYKVRNVELYKLEIVGIKSDRWFSSLKRNNERIVVCK